MKRLTPAARLILGLLKAKYKYFSELRMLADDGSFYCTDDFIMQRLELCDNTVKRARISLKKAGEIDYVIGKHKGAPTRYWIISKGANLYPFGGNTKGAKMSAKGANLVSEGCQNGTLYTNEVKNESNKNVPDKSSFTQEVKDGIRSYANLVGASRVNTLLTNKGCDPESIRQVLEGIEEKSFVFKG